MVSVRDLMLPLSRLPVYPLTYDVGNKSSRTRAPQSDHGQCQDKTSSEACPATFAANGGSQDSACARVFKNSFVEKPMKYFDPITSSS